MPKAYWIVFYHSISDPKKLEAYAKLAPAATTPFGSRYLARGPAAAVFEFWIEAARRGYRVSERRKGGRRLRVSGVPGSAARAR